jgi:hypothetical protein
MDQVAIRVENAEQSSLIEPHTRLKALQRILGYEKDSLHRTVVSPKPDGTPRGVIKAVLIRKTQRHLVVLIALGREAFRLVSPMNRQASYRLEVARLRLAQLCVARFFPLFYVAFPRCVRVLPFVVQLDLCRSLV